MSHSRALAWLLATLSLLAAPFANAQIGIQAIPAQTIPSGKTLVVPIPATDPDGPARSYSISIGPLTTTSGTTMVTATNAGITAAIRTGDPHFVLGVSYTDSNGIIQTGTMEFQLLREFAPLTSQIIAGLTEGGFYSPTTTGSATKYITFHRVFPGFVIQGGDPNGNGTGGPGFTFPNEFSSALIFSGTAGQLAMANSGYGVTTGATGRVNALATLHDFSPPTGGTNADGAAPFGGLVTGTDGNLYGTAKSGGADGDGVIYQIITGGSTAGSFNTLYSFTGGDDGANPSDALLSGSGGNFYGTTETGGANGAGTIFQIATSGSSPVLNTLYSFTGGADGGNPYGGLVEDGSGNFYGTTETGGANGEGTVFQLTVSGSLNTLYTFSPLTGGTNADGANPYAGVILANDGNLYGTAFNGGANGEGTVFQVSTSGTFNTFYTFSALVNGTNADGANPYGGIYQANDGNLYGTTTTGGASRAAAGTVYQIEDFSGNFEGFNTLHSFTGALDGGNPHGGLVQDTDGNLYGTTQTSGAGGQGTIFQITTAGSLNTVFSFDPLVSGTNASGAGAYAALIAGTGGALYGTAVTGGLHGEGTVFELSNTNSVTTVTKGSNGTNGSQFFVTLASGRSSLDFTYTLFGQMLRGYDTLFGIAGTPVQDNGSGEDSSPLNPVDITSAAVTHNETDAVLLLSATGVCQGTVTVTAMSGTASTTGTFGISAVADATNDPPFLTPPANITARNGTAKVTLMGTDLQLDLLRYGFQRLLPATDPSITSGTSPLLSIPLFSNTDNAIIAALDHWNASSRGFDERIFHIGAGDKPIRGTLSAIPQGTGGKLNLATYPVAVFTAGNTRDKAASFTASVNWGDGTYLTGSNISVVKDGSGLTVNRFKLMAGHDYTSPGQYPVIVNISDPGGAYLTLSGTASVEPSDIALSGSDIYRAGGVLSGQVLATFSDRGAASTAADYTADIDWGDGSVTAGAVATGKKVPFQVLGTHTYLTPNTFTITTTVTRTGSNGYSASEWSTAHISGVNAPQVFPPFPQAHLAQMWSTIYEDTPAPLTTATSTGGNPYGPLVQGTNGNFYGTTYDFGGNGSGTVYQLTASGSLNTLYNFSALADGTNADGAYPYAPIVQGTDGNFYGTTVGGGPGGAGTVFQIDTSGSLTTLHAFGALTGGTNSDGANPYGALVQTADGNFYGATKNGGVDGAGTIFQIATSGSAFTFSTLYAFTGGDDGAGPVAGLITGSDGNLYGTTIKGGASNAGAVFQITTSGSLTTLHSFAGGDDGANPFAGLVTGTDGNLYGTTETDGSNGSGTIYELSISGSVPDLATLYSFTALVNGTNADGANPYESLITGTDGALLGTTTAGGADGVGTIYQLVTSGSVPTVNTLYTFTGGNDGGSPFASLIAGTNGDLYGTTETDGTYGAGTAYQLATSGSAPVLTTLGSFSGGTPVVTATNSQIALRCSVQIVNSGNKTSEPGSFSVYVDPNGELDGQQTIFTSNGQSAFPIPALAPGKSVLFSFQLKGTTIDTRLKLPLNFDPSGQSIIGVVTYSDPVGDFDGSAKIYSPGHF